jgi:hypothetical protein
MKKATKKVVSGLSPDAKEVSNNGDRLQVKSCTILHKSKKDMSVAVRINPKWERIILDAQAFGLSLYLVCVPKKMGATSKKAPACKEVYDDLKKATKKKEKIKVAKNPRKIMATRKSSIDDGNTKKKEKPSAAFKCAKADLRRSKLAFEKKLEKKRA